MRNISQKNFSTHEEEQLFFALVRAGFAHKRKFVRKNLTDSGLSAGNIAEKARAEDLSLQEWLNLART